jgi:hypothetical protein
VLWPEKMLQSVMQVLSGRRGNLRSGFYSCFDWSGPKKNSGRKIVDVRLIRT